MNHVLGCNILAGLLLLIVCGFSPGARATESNFKIDPAMLMPQGDSYEATVPATLDLAERARLGVRGLTNFLNPKNDYAPFGHSFFNTRPAYMSFGGGSPNWGKISEGLIMARIMSGSRENLDIEAKTLSGMIRFSNLSGSTPEARILMALMTLYDQTPDPGLMKLLEKVAGGLQTAPKRKDGIAWYYDGEPLLDDSSLGIMGYANQAFIQGTAMRALSRWSVVAGDKQTLALVGQLKDFLVKPKFWQPEAAPKAIAAADHAWFMGHHHSYIAGLMGLLWYADAAGDARIKQFVRDGYEYYRNYGIARIGLFGEMCTTGDMTFLAIKLSDAGVGDYWDDADCYVRNALAELQITDAEKMRKANAAIPAGPVIHWQTQKPVTADNATTDSVIERTVGAFLSECTYPTYIPQNRYLFTICCTGNCMPALYWAWESAARFKDGAGTVHLLLNRASPWFDVDSYLPYEGKVVIRNKKADKLSVRIPGWANKKAVAGAVNGKSAPSFWVGQYLIFDHLAAGDIVTITFPMVESTETYTLKWQDTGFWLEATNPGSKWTPKPQPDRFTMHFKGNTLVSIDPAYKGNLYALYQRDELKQNTAPMMKVNRFVTPTVIRW